MEKLATDIYSFDNLRKRGFACVDKTRETPATIWLMEFKLGLSFSSELRTITDAKIAGV